VNGRKPGGVLRYDSLLEELRDRRSIRRWRPDDVPDDDVRRLLEAARWAPSPTNRQPWRFRAVREAATLRRMREAVSRAAGEAARAAGVDGESFDRYVASFVAFAEAPLVIAVLMRRPSRVSARLGAELSEDERTAFAGDLPAVGAAIQNLLLAAQALGYGACWTSGPLLAAAELRRALDAPPSLELVALVPVGRPAEDPPVPVRHPLERLLVQAKEPRE
jgi:nitroreductase